jgi:hypothetical protein
MLHLAFLYYKIKVYPSYKGDLGQPDVHFCLRYMSPYSKQRNAGNCRLPSRLFLNLKYPEESISWMYTMHGL